MESDKAAGTVAAGGDTAGRGWWRKLRLWQKLALCGAPIVVLIVVMVAAVSVMGRPYVISSTSMEPTLHGCTGCTDDRVFVDEWSYRFGGSPRPGDVVVMKGPTSGWNPHGGVNEFVKRVIAVGGQTVQCCDPQGRIMVDGKPIDEKYTNYSFPYTPGQSFLVSTPAGTEINRAGREFGPITVPQGNVWVMGDNRNNSLDSRALVGDQFHGTVPVSDIIGKAVYIISPLSRIGSIGGKPTPAN